MSADAVHPAVTITHPRALPRGYTSRYAAAGPITDCTLCSHLHMRGIPVADHERLTAAPDAPRREAIVAENDPFLRRAVALVLSRSGYRVREAADGAAALACFHDAEYSPCLLVADWHMPPIDGLSLIHQVQCVRPGTRCVLMSSRIPSNFDPSIPFLAKPFCAFELLEATGAVPTSKGGRSRRVTGGGVDQIHSPPDRAGASLDESTVGNRQWHVST